MYSAWAYRTTRCVQKFDTCLNYRHPCGVNLSPCLRSVFCKLCLTCPLISMISRQSTTGRSRQQTRSLLSWIHSLQRPVFSFLNIQPVDTLSSLLTTPNTHPVYTLSSLFLKTKPVNTLSSLPDYLACQHAVFSSWIPSLSTTRCLFFPKYPACRHPVFSSWIPSLSTPCHLSPEYPACQHPVLSFPEYPACQHPVISLLNIHHINPVFYLPTTRPVLKMSSIVLDSQTPLSMPCHLAL